MIRVCAGYERENGEKVHQGIRILGIKRPYLKLVRTDGLCPECAAAYREDAQRYHREHVDALRASRIAERYKECAGVPTNREPPNKEVSGYPANVQRSVVAGTPAQSNQGGGATDTSRRQPDGHCSAKPAGAPLPADMRLKG